ncbi:AAA family ATPase [Solitalea lacus]|uniref:AAA family ATPase n=1 Tax=Solitalea lacus TaxID=2911172 RepID=UPI001EDC2244|nr:ATP-binding protein [Solitalea lacus]UKJ08412.1 ATP-binding protein [Solitalea lacus]
MDKKASLPIIKICIYGPESTGKSTLAAYLAVKFESVCVPEIARDFITSNDFTVEDIVEIGRAQTEAVLTQSATANKFLFCDTDLITTQIYSDYYLGVIPEELYELEKKVSYDLYFLTDIDVPWVPDGLRGLWHNRAEMFERFKSELDKRNIKYYLVQGSFQERQQFAVNIIRELFDEENTLYI